MVRSRCFCKGSTDRLIFSLHTQIPAPTIGILTYFPTWRDIGYFLVLKGISVGSKYLADGRLREAGMTLYRVFQMMQ